MQSSSGLRCAKACATLTTSIASAVILWSSVSQAQGDDPSEPSGDVEEIRVTGSRIVRDGYDTPTPVTVLGEQEIEADAPSSIAEFIEALPSVQGSSTPSSSSAGLSGGNAGIASLNLRALGAGRSLVLFDGHRSVVSSSSGQVDINTFPQSLVERVEIVTGGASATYGSDAISGVINLILDRDFTGIETSLAYGQTTYGDAENAKFTLTAGTPFANERGHVLFSTEIFDKQGVHETTRDWGETGFFQMINPDTSSGGPHFIMDHGIGISNYTPGGLITSGPLRGTYFGEGGSVQQLTYGDVVSGQWMQGGDWQYTTSAEIGTGSLAADEERKSVFGRASYIVGPDIEVFAQASYADYQGFSGYLRPIHRGVTIFADNAFLPPEISQQMAVLGLSSFELGTSNADVNPSGNRFQRDTTRYVIGANADFDAFDKNWIWDAYYQKGITNTDEHQVPTFNTEHIGLATDAVVDPDTGEIVCRSTLTGPSNGCVPMNRFGVGVASQEALDYVLGRPRRTQEFQQDVVAINFTTNDFSGWAGPISLAFGAEYRKEQMTGHVDPVFVSGWEYGNYQVTEGDYDVAEAYLETLVPVMDRLEFNGAVRFTDYSTSGMVTTWKAGLVYSPIESLTFRLTKSRDIRGPNLGELFAAGTARSNSVGIGDQAVDFVQNLRGNPTVGPEEADTLGIGVVYQPSFLPGFSAAADYYDIEVDGVIDFIEAQPVTDFCFLFNIQTYCDRMHFAVPGDLDSLTTIDLFYENLNRLEASGVDYELTYLFDRGDFFGAPGTLNLRAMLTNYLHNITDNGVTQIDLAGSNLADTPDWVYRITARYSLESWNFSLIGRGVSAGVVSNAYIECTSDCPPSVPPNFTINENDVEGRTYLDAYASKNFLFADVDFEAFFSLKNVFDHDPAFVRDPSLTGSKSRPGFVPTNRAHYDVLGRTYLLGIRAEF